MKKIKEHIYLAALLHDIGKFYQRADTGNVSTSKYLSQTNKTESILPQHKGAYTHKYCLWTAQFMDDNRDVFANLTGTDSSDLTGVTDLRDLAVCYHLQKEQLSSLGQIVKEADSLSSGVDTDSEEAFKDYRDEASWDAFKKRRMVSVFETIKQKTFETKWHLPVTKLSVSKDYFPKADFQSNPDYSGLWKEFIDEFTLIRANTCSAFGETLLNLLYKYTACIPASTVNFPDVSLYDHAKTRAALAVCLYDFQQSGEQSPQPFLLIGADLSGIKSYLYQIVSKHAGKNLKGRSFFLHLLSDAVTRYLLKELNLFQANVICNSGGSVYLTAPNTDFVRKKIREISDIIEQKFFTSFGTSLFVAIDAVAISKDVLMHKSKQENLGQIWHTLFEKCERKKSSKFASLIESRYNSFFAPIHQGGDALRDEITGEEFLESEKSENTKLIIKKDTNQQIILGEKLQETDLMIVSDKKLKCLDNEFYINPADLGFYYYFPKNEQLTQSVDNSSIVRFNNCTFHQPVKGNNNSCEFRFYGGNKFNRQAFEDLSQNPNISNLGVLRMDADNLSSVFQKEIPPERATLSRFATLSRLLDYFFSGYLNKIRETTDTENQSFIIHSGGDDVFIVGSWDVTITLAKRIREDFREFTCHSNLFGISGGMSVIPAKFPLIKGAEESENEEQHAKNHSVKGTGKNAFSFMNMPLNWEKEFQSVEKLKEKMVDLIDKNIVPRTFISTISAHWANAETKKHKVGQVKTYWRLTYDLTRMKDRIKNETAKQMMTNCITEVCGNTSSLDGLPISTGYHPLELWAFAARWAEFEYKKSNKY
ncbi:MAG: type III-A CRISPR-associated protein Cas10/Csm1 [Prevotellaceae bacterium]|jgi:CRISPR-associated protein Csm1|nr:type III-A CRISPR-associated protein Cas10/Csm1 [Prevotellaceae bacterium]